MKRIIDGIEFVDNAGTQELMECSVVTMQRVLQAFPCEKVVGYQRRAWRKVSDVLAAKAKWDEPRKSDGRN